MCLPYRPTAPNDVHASTAPQSYRTSRPSLFYSPHNDSRDVVNRSCNVRLRSYRVARTARILPSVSSVSLTRSRTALPPRLRVANGCENLVKRAATSPGEVPIDTSINIGQTFAHPSETSRRSSTVAPLDRGGINFGLSPRRYICASDEPVLWYRYANRFAPRIAKAQVDVS